MSQLGGWETEAPLHRGWCGMVTKQAALLREEFLLLNLNSLAMKQSPIPELSITRWRDSVTANPICVQEGARRERREV